MPEFQLDLGDDRARKRYQELDSFTQGYIEALFFTDIDENVQNANFGMLAESSLDSIKEDCADFQLKNIVALEKAYEKEGYDAAQAGRDFWYTRQGHGVGYWDRDLGLLDKAAEAYGESYPYASVTIYVD